ncbi:conserved hypothetical protein [Methanocaldococcus infernus ME]|uniref:Uncharacterized protein n=1 Tax=Methanocaldococcus infernus (strain DSM 11812 / JCM 15783 / ME) TaxID=573063 RepID=D5VQQ9_METIM|nr:hypothetical protein [Methanocaldococcus infernus]ADG12912.1 conserved hypothetical protein [Methanocaldococcus infernus ME]
MFNILREIKHSKELISAKDEIFVGELIRYMYKNGGYLINISSLEHSHNLTFKFKNSKIYKLNVSVERKVDGLASKLIGSQTLLTLEVIKKKELVEPEEVIKMIGTDLKNMLKVPLFGQVKIDHDLNYIKARTTYIIDLNKFIHEKEVNKEELEKEIEKIIGTLIESLEEV